MHPKPMDDNHYGPPEKQKLEVKIDLLKFLRFWKGFRKRRKERHELQGRGKKV